jgi:hypothetical protein
MKMEDNMVLRIDGLLGCCTKCGGWISAFQRNCAASIFRLKKMEADVVLGDIGIQLPHYMAH